MIRIQKLKESLNLKLAFIASTFTSMDESNIWLIGGSMAKCYDDNAGAFFTYVRQFHPEIDIRWVIRKHSPDIDRIKQIGPVVYKHSIKANWLALKAKVILVTHSIKGDIARYSIKKLKGSKKIHLEHGVFGLKRISSSKDYDLIVCSGEGDAEIKREIHQRDDLCIITGLPQHDTLLKQKNKPRREKSILLMLTWRDWIVKSNNIENSVYFQCLSQFLEDPELHAFLTANDITLNCIVHRNFHVHFDKFKKTFHPLIKILSKESNIQENILKNDILITDYSSISWEFLLLDKKVIFYQFDQEEYLEKQGSFLNFDSGLFGAITKNHKECLSLLIKAYQNPNDEIPRREYFKSKFLPFSDMKNSERIFVKILATI